MPARRSQTTSRSSTRSSDLDSPQWKSGKDVIFKTPNSPSPVRRVTRRSSIYQRKPTKTDISKFRVPSSSMVSPPGVKTRARRSSIYQKGGSRLLSPETMIRARRASMYVSSRSKPAVNEFSKVFHTPIKVKSPVQEIMVPRKASPVKQALSKGKTPQRNRKRSTSPKKLTTPFKSPPIPTLRKRKVSETLKSPTVKKENNSDQVDQPRRNIKSKTPARQQNTPKRSPVKPDSPITASTKNKGSQSAKKPKVSGTPSRNVTASVASMNIVTSTPAKSLDKSITSESFYGTPTKSGSKTPLQKKPDSPVTSTTKKRGSQSAKKPKVSKTPSVKASAASMNMVTSTPAKSLDKSKAGKSFYGTPGETPVIPEVSSVQLSAKKSNKKSCTPKSSLLKSSKTPKSAARRKTPAVKRSHTFDSPLSATKNATLRSAKKASKPILSPMSKAAKLCTTVTVELTPVEERQAFKNINGHSTNHAAENINSGDSDSPTPRKIAKLTDAAGINISPKPVKSTSISPKKLTKLENENNSSVLHHEESMTSNLGNETFSSDSRSGRCTIL